MQFENFTIDGNKIFKPHTVVNILSFPRCTKRSLILNIELNINVE